MKIYSLYIINKAGGLIYQRDFSDNLSKLSSNEYLVLAGTFHGIHALTARIAPLDESSGLEVLETGTFKLFCNQTNTGIKYLIVTSTDCSGVDVVFKRLYELYSDYVMKNPFYKPEMPIRCELFDTNLLKTITALKIS